MSDGPNDGRPGTALFPTKWGPRVKQAIDGQLTALAAHLAARRDAILQAWRKAVDRDPELTTGASLPRSQLNDHIPDLLEAFGRKLCAVTGSEITSVTKEHKEGAASHGLQRWQQGYDLREVTREWGRLQLCMADELEAYAVANPEVEIVVMSTARRAWTEMSADGVSESTARYFQLQQAEAMGNFRDLDEALKQMRELESQRAELWRQAAHDLRGNLSVVVNATAGLNQQSDSGQLRDSMVRILNRNVSSLQSLLEGVMDLARLQAGHERRDVMPFDAALVLRELCERMQPLAEERGLFLKTDGPAMLPVEGDSIKIQRIAQNLLLNALKYTRRGGVTVNWGDSRKNDPNRWMLCVQDTGPGLHPGPAAPMAGALEEATAEARQVDNDAGSGNELPAVAEASPPAAADSARGQIPNTRGEGIGLSIVKRLCELLDATMEMESDPGEGSTFRILLPRRYDANATR